MKRAPLVVLLWFLAAALASAADITGTWTFDVQLDAGSGSPTFSFEQKGEALTGKYQGQLGEAPLKGTVKGNKIQFTFQLEQGGQSGTVEYEGEIESATAMKGKAKYGSLGAGT